MSASDRGWGPGWPNCQYNKWVTITLSNGQKLVVRGEISFLVKGLCEETMRRGYGLVEGWNWGAACRAIRGTQVPQVASNHSWALAVDLNAPKNPMGSTLITDMPRWMPELWADYGFRWGGTYTRRPDAMHYEFMGTPADAARLTKKFLEDQGDTPVTKEEMEVQALVTAATVLKLLQKQGKTIRGLRVAEDMYDNAIVPGAGGWNGLARHFALEGGGIGKQIKEALGDLTVDGSDITEAKLEEVFARVLASAKVDIDLDISGATISAAMESAKSELFGEESANN